MFGIKEARDFVAGIMERGRKELKFLFHLKVNHQGREKDLLENGYRDISGSLQVAGRHLARLAVALEVVADLLAFHELAHSGALYGGDVNKRIGAAIVRLNEAEALRRIEPFNCASGHDEPFHSNRRPQRRKRCGW